MAVSGALAREVTQADVQAAGAGGLPSDVALACTAQDIGGATVQHDGFLMDPPSLLTPGVLAVHAKALWGDNHHTGQAQIPSGHAAEEDRMVPMLEEERRLDGEAHIPNQVTHQGSPAS